MIEVLKANIAPYLSILLGVDSKYEEDDSIHESIIQLIKEEAKKENELIFSETTHEDVNEIGSFKFTSYQIKKKPSWLVNSDIADVEHHVLISFKVKNYVAFYFSEKGKKDEIRAFFGKKKLPSITPVNIKQLNFNFINEDKVKMLWLSAIHGKSNFKADSKVIGGDSVADTLDPLIDQSYMMSAVRTEIEGQKSTLGVNPFKSSIWRGPCNNWQTFENRVLEVLDILTANVDENDSPISILSYPIADCVKWSSKTGHLVRGF